MTFLQVRSESRTFCDWRQWDIEHMHFAPILLLYSIALWRKQQMKLLMAKWEAMKFLDYYRRYHLSQPSFAAEASWLSWHRQSPKLFCILFWKWSKLWNVALGIRSVGNKVGRDFKTITGLIRNTETLNSSCSSLHVSGVSIWKGVQCIIQDIAQESKRINLWFFITAL